MMKRILRDSKFWKSVFSLGAAFIAVFVLLFWGVNGFKMSFWDDRDPVQLIAICLVSGLFYGFFVTYGKFWAKYKREQQ